VGVEQLWGHTRGLGTTDTIACMGLGCDISRAQARVLARLPHLTSLNILDGECTPAFRSLLRNQHVPSPFARRLRELHLKNALLTCSDWNLLGRTLAESDIHTIHLDYTSLPSKDASSIYPCFPSVRTLRLSREFEDDNEFRDYQQGDGFADQDDTLYRLQRVYQMFPRVECLSMEEPVPQYLYDQLHTWWTDSTSPYALHALQSLQLVLLLLPSRLPPLTPHMHPFGFAPY
jgi:hypothetical protein